MTTTNPYKHLDVHTNKGAAHMVAGQSVGSGQPDVAALVTGGVFVDRETLEIGVAVDNHQDIYEIVDLSTDSTVDILTFWDNTDREITQLAIDPADYAFVVGEYVATTLEIAIVTHIVVNSATDWDVSFYRGVAGTSIVAHSTGTDAIEVQEGTALVAGTITVPAIGVTAAIGLDALAAIIGVNGDRGPAGYNGVINDKTQLVNPQWNFENLDDTTGLLSSTVGGPRGETLDDTNVANAAWDETTTNGGDTVNAAPHVALTRVPTAAEVTAALMYLKVNFHVLAVNMYAYITATGAAVAADATVAFIDDDSGVITITDAGLVNFVTTDTYVFEVIGAPVAVADCAVVG